MPNRDTVSGPYDENARRKVLSEFRYTTKTLFTALEALTYSISLLVGRLPRKYKYSLGTPMIETCNKMSVAFVDAYNTSVQAPNAKLEKLEYLRAQLGMLIVNINVISKLGSTAIERIVELMYICKSIDTETRAWCQSLMLANSRSL